MSNLTKRSTLTGNEEFQVSATEKVTSQQIADLAPAKGVKQVVVTDFQTNTWKLSDGGSVSFPMDIKDGEIVTFTSAKDATTGPGVALFGYAIKYNSLMASYVGMTMRNKVNGIPTIYTYKSAGAYATAWQQLPDASVKTVEITDFAIPGLNITKDGESFLFYANDASNIPNSNHGATSFVGVAIASPIFITGDQRLLYYMMVDTARGMFYTGRANLEDDTVAWNNTPVTRLGQAVQVTDFKSNTFSNGKIGDIAVGEMFTFTSAVDAANGPGSALVGYAVKVSALSVKYIGTSPSINTYKRSYLYTYQSTSIYATNWSVLGTPTGIEASVYEFTLREGANNVPTDDLKLVKVADIFRMVFSTPDQADYGQLDFIRSQDNDKTDQYVFVCPSVDTGATLGGTLLRIAVDATTGAVDLTGVGIAMVGQAAQKVMVTNFVAPTNAVIQNLSAGQGLIIYALANATGLPSGVTGTAFYGHCIKNTLTNSYTYLLQTADGSRTFSGSTNGTTTTWTELGGGSGVKKLPGLDVELNESTGVIPYTSIELAQLQPGVTLMLCFEIADADGRFSPSGNVVVYYDLPSANNSWNTIAGFFDNATSSNGSINVRRRVAGVLDFQCTSGLLEGYPGLQVYLKHIFVLG